METALDITAIDDFSETAMFKKPIAWYHSRATQGLDEALVFLVDDDLLFLKALESSIRKALPTVKIRSFQTGEACLHELDEKPDVVVLDYFLNGNIPYAWDGVDVLKQIKKVQPDTEVVMLSSQDSLNVAISCIEKGAYDYISKSKMPFSKVNKVVSQITETKIVDSPLFKFIQLIILAFIIAILLYTLT